MRGYCLPSRVEDLDAILLDGLRQQDQDEILATGRDPSTALRDSFVASRPHCLTIWADQYQVGMIGVAPVPGKDHHGIVWCLATDTIYQIKQDFVDQAPYWVAYFNDIYPVIQNWVSERNTVSVNWLKGLDFIFDDSREYFNGVAFLRFYRCGDPHV